MQEIPPQRLNRFYLLIAQHLHFFQRPHNLMDVARAVEDIADEKPTCSRKPQKITVSHSE